MKAINKFFYALLAFVVVGMVSCTKEATHEPGAPELEGCYGVYFPDATVYEAQGPMGELSLDPSEATTFTYVAFRENTDGEITVPVKVIENTTDAEGTPMYTVSDIVFGDGEDVAQFTVALSEKAEVGVPYTLTLEVENDPLYVKQYDITTVPSLSVTINRVKWISLGKCQFTEDLITSWWGFNWDYPTHPTYLVEVQVRADSIDQAAFDAAIAGTGEDSGLSGIYRMVNAWLVGPWGDDSDKEYNESIAANPIYTIINAQPYDKVWIPLQEIGLAINGGMASIYSYPAALTDLGRASDIQDSMYGKIENGAITFPAENSLLGCPGGDYVGSNTYSANIDGAFKLVLSAALGTYELAMPNAEEDGDFSFREVKLADDALFYSESQAAAWTPTLEEGRCEVSTKDADRIFRSEYGVLYRLPDLYAEGYPIYFAALEDGTITLPKDYINQKTGLVQSGYEVLMAIDAEASTFDPKTGELALAAEFFVGEGDDAVSYGVFAELISTKAPEFPVTPMLDLKNDFSYKELFSATLKSAFLKSEFEATVEQGTSLVDAELFGTAYRMPGLYTAGYDIYFVADEEGNVGITAGYELQATGINIYGKPAYMQIVGGTCSEAGVTLQARFVDSEGTALVPGLCKETMSNYVWVDVATGSWECNVLNNPIAGLTLQNAQGTNLYRVVDFMTSATGVEGNHFVFTWDKTSNLCEVQGLIDTGIPASALGVSGVNENVHFADEKTTWNSLGYDDTWESLYADYGASVQPYYSPEYNAFVFRVSYFLPEAGGALAFPTSTGKTNFVNEIFYLDGEVSEGPQWVDVCTGSYYSSLFIDADNYYVPFTNRKLQNLENTNEFRIVNFTDAGTDFNFTWDTTTHKIDVVGLNDTGVDSTPMNGKGNIFACDVRTFFKSMGYDLTWEQVASQIGGDAQSYFDAQNGEFVFNLVLAAPEVGPGVALGGGTIYTDYFVPDSPAAAASTSSANATIKKATSIKGATVKKHNLAKNSNTSSAYKSINLGVAKMSKEAKAVRSLKTVTPVKREAKIKKAML